jgi:hypothetical protein
MNELVNEVTLAALVVQALLIAGYYGRIYYLSKKLVKIKK